MADNSNIHLNISLSTKKYRKAIISYSFKVAGVLVYNQKTDKLLKVFRHKLSTSRKNTYTLDDFVCRPYSFK